MIDAAWRDAQNVLLIRLDNLGDVLVTTPAMHAVRVGLPNARLTLLTSPVGAQAGRLNPDLDDVLVYEAPWMDPWRQLPHDPAREAATIAEIARRRFDAAIIFTSFRQSSLPAAYLCYLAGIPLRAAASIDGPGSLVTTRHKHPERMMHEVERGLDLVGALGFPTAPTALVLRVPGRARAEIAGLADACDDGRPVVVIHPGCSMPARTYPWDGFAAVAGLLVENLAARVVVTGAAAEADLVARVVDAVPPLTRDSVRPAAGVFSFPGLCALIERADLVVTNNTGPMHIAAAVQTPVVALFALTNPPEQWGPWRVPHRLLNHDVPCRLCYSRICPTTHDCLRLVTPDDVLAAARELLAERRSPDLALAGAGAAS
ncbi:MAG TPA: glycosyltransferase family 9 protein [Thermomicrobiales bacterium]|nr:glycosyltransferase family 9 protein [Thermomicrobiales bacterium]